MTPSLSTRRSLAAGSLLAAGVLLLAACGAPAAPTASATVPPPLAATAPGPSAGGTGPAGPGAPAVTPPAPAPPAAAGGPAPVPAQSPATAQTPAQPPATAPTPPPASKPVYKLRNVYGPLYTDDPVAKDQKVVMLTFDDGPSAVGTARILDILQEQGVRAMFFVTGYGIRNNDELLRRMVAEGHVVGTHTVNHENLRKANKEQQRQVIVPVNEAVERITGQKVRYFRPPYGAYDDETLALMKELNLTLVNWSHGSGDWMEVRGGYKDPQVVVADVLADKPRNSQMTPLHPGAIILLHDTHRHTAEALPDIIKGLRALGYDFVVLEN